MSLTDYFTQTLKENETVVAVLRKHWITLALPVTIAVIGIGLLIAFMDIFFRGPIGFGLWLVLFLGFLAYAGYRWVVYFFDSFIITDMRIIDIDQHGLFKRTVTETTFEKVQDVTYSIMGIVATAMDYGSVSVQTAAEESLLELKNVARPKQVHELITEAQKLYEERHGDPDMSAKELIELIAKVKPKRFAQRDETQDSEFGGETDGGDVEE